MRQNVLQSNVNKLQIFFMPIKRNQWGLHALFDVNETKYNDISSEYFNNIEIDSEKSIEWKTNSSMILKKLDKWRHKAFESVHDFWIECSNSNQNSWKGKVYQYGLLLMKRIHCHEIFLVNYYVIHQKSLFKFSQGNHNSFNYKIQFILPSQHLSDSDALKYLTNISKHGIHHHRRLYYQSWLCIPFSMCLGIIPGPNLPFYWNCYRLYCHYRAYQGSQILYNYLSIMNTHSINSIDNDLLNKISVNIDGNTEDIIAELCQIYECPSLMDDFKRHEYQINNLNKKYYLDLS